MPARPIWIIAHRCNGEDDIPAALRRGANAIECDVMSKGKGFIVRHPGPIDFHVPSFPSYLRVLRAHAHRVCLLYVDYKGPDFSASAGRRLVATLNKSGVVATKTKVLFSIGTLTNRRVFREVPRAPWIGVQVDENNNPVVTARVFRKASIPNVCYADGITSWWFEPDRVEKHIAKAIKLRNAQAGIQRVIVWTIDRQSSMRKYLRMGVDGILTNDPADVVEILRESAKLRRATPDDVLWGSESS